MKYPKEFTWSLPSGGILLLEPDAYDIMNPYRQKRRRDKESGGCLLGFYRGTHIHITACTTPMPLDKCTRTRFDRQDPDHVATINTFHKVTMGYGTYLGEWHTHPEATPTPSGIDRREWLKISRHRGNMNSIFLILGTDGVWASVSKGDMPTFSLPILIP